MSETLSKETIEASLLAKFRAHWGKKDKPVEIEVWYSDWSETWYMVASLPPKGPVHDFFKPNDPDPEKKPLDEVLATIAFRASMMPTPQSPN